MINKKFYIPFLVYILYLNLVSGGRIQRELGQQNDLDELDRVTIEKTGCKFLTLPKGEKKSFSANDPTLNNILSTQIRYNKNITKFELHFGIRSDANVIVTLSRQDEKGSLIAAYVLTYGKNSAKTIVKGRWEEFRNKVFSPDLLSADKYENLRIDLDRFSFHGKECEPFAFFSDIGNNVHKDITQFDFEAKSEHGAKILYDCPKDFAKCKCAHEAPKTG